MGRRIEVELTSSREDGSWTWRAAGAREPKGELLGTLLYEGAKVGDVVKADAEFHVDGIEITEVMAPKQKKDRANFLQLKSRPLRDDELVTTQRVSGGRRGGKGRGRDRGDGPRDRPGRDRRSNRDDRPPRPQPSALSRPKPKRLRPRRTHRDALLAATPEEHRPIVEQVVRDGMPGVRAAVKKQNEEAKEAGKPEIDAAPILAIAEKNLAKARLAEWRDRADAALAIADELDLRDLRSVVVAGNDVARDDESRELTEKLRKTLDERIESDHLQWVGDLEEAIEQGRVVRALRLSSRPVKAGAPLPPELATNLAGQASAALASDVAQDRWATVLDALAFSPVRGAVTPEALPAEPGQELLDAVKRLSDRIPRIAQLFGIDPAAVPKSAKRRRGPRKAADGGSGNAKKKSAKVPKPPSGDAAPSAEADTPSAPPETAEAASAVTETVEATADAPAATETTETASAVTETVETASPATETASDTPATETADTPEPAATDSVDAKAEAPAVDDSDSSVADAPAAPDSDVSAAATEASTESQEAANTNEADPDTQP